MKDYISKHKILIIILIVVIPLLIYCFFKWPAPLPCLDASGILTAGDVLGFYGVILGAFFAAEGVFLTIQDAQSKYREDIKKQVLPFIAVTSLIISVESFSITDLLYEEEVFDNKDSNNTKKQYREYVLDEIVFIIKNGEISFSSELNSNQKKILNHKGLVPSPSSNGKVIIQKSFVYHAMMSENAGKGIANLLRIGLNSTQKKNEDFIFIQPTTLNVDQSIKISIYCEDITKKDLGDYYLDFLYEDIYRNSYRQRSLIHIHKDDSGKINSWMDGVFRQEEM